MARGGRFKALTLGVRPRRCPPDVTKKLNHNRGTNGRAFFVRARWAGLAEGPVSANTGPLPPHQRRAPTSDHVSSITLGGHRNPRARGFFRDLEAVFLQRGAPPRPRFSFASLICRGSISSKRNSRAAPAILHSEHNPVLARRPSWDPAPFCAWRLQRLETVLHPFREASTPQIPASDAGDAFPEWRTSRA